MIDRWIELTNLFEGAGIEVEMEGTPSCPVLYHRTDHGTLVGIDLETVCLYQDRGQVEMPFELAFVEHQGDGVAILNLVRVLSTLSVPTDLAHVLASVSRT